MTKVNFRPKKGVPASRANHHRADSKRQSVLDFKRKPQPHLGTNRTRFACGWKSPPSYETHGESIFIHAFLPTTSQALRFGAVRNETKTHKIVTQSLVRPIMHPPRVEAGRSYRRARAMFWFRRTVQHKYRLRKTNKYSIMPYLVANLNFIVCGPKRRHGNGDCGQFWCPTWNLFFALEGLRFIGMKLPSYYLWSTNHGKDCDRCWVGILYCQRQIILI